MTVIADEVHAPMTLPGAQHVPVPLSGMRRRRTGSRRPRPRRPGTSPGSSARVIVAGSDAMHETLQNGVPSHLRCHAGHFGVLAAIAAFEHGGEWLDALVRHLDRQPRRFSASCSRSTCRASATCRRRPATSPGSTAARSVSATIRPTAFLERGRVALGPGPTFGEQGRGFARLNFGTSAALLEEAVRRMAAVA